MVIPVHPQTKAIINEIESNYALPAWVASTLNAQDPRERHYYYEILDPRHEPKPLVEGFARERVTENLNRGLTVTPARDGKGIYLSWRLLASDAPGTAFHVYREADGKARRLTKKPLTQTCDFMDVTPAEKRLIGWKLW